MRIARRLHNEALSLCEFGEPCLFSIISLLENEDEIKTFLQENKECFLDKDDPLFEKSVEVEKNGPSHHKQGLTKKKNRNKLNTQEIVRQDREIRENFMLKQKNSQYLKMKECRRQLPAWNKIDEILDTVYKNQVVIISGETGCGKSTQVCFAVLISNNY